MPHGTDSPVAMVRRAGTRVAAAVGAADGVRVAEALAVAVGVAARGRSEDPHATRASAASGATQRVTAGSTGVPGA
jgi:hypothetical protein